VNRRALSRALGASAALAGRSPRSKSDAFVKRMLDEYGYVIRNVNFEVPGSKELHYGVRVSTHVWSNVDDVNGLVDAMKDLSGKMA